MTNRARKENILLKDPRMDSEVDSTTMGIDTRIEMKTLEISSRSRQKTKRNSYYKFEQ